MDRPLSDTPDLRTRLIKTQYGFNRAKSRALAIVISGDLAADVEDSINRLTRWMDPRNIRVYAQDEREVGGNADGLNGRPPDWWFWTRLPARGQISIFYDGWYRPVIDPETRPYYKADLECLCRFEAMLEAEKVSVLKIWLDRKPGNFETRVHDLEGDPETAWQVTQRDRLNLKDLKRHRKQVHRILRHCGNNPWTVLPMDDGAPPDAIGETVLTALSATPAPQTETTHPPQTKSKDVLDQIDLDKRLAKSHYKRTLRHWQGKLRELTRDRAFADHSLVVAFEGLDAAGKGGAIRRLTRAIDPRQWEVVPISAPTEEDLLHPWLWRFWQHVPASGDVTIFDRSWYGRVLVERVDGLIPKADWQRAWQEIRDFEKALTDHGVVLVKIWLALSAEEQMRRFHARQDDPHKRYKITDEDWKAFEKRDAYLNAVSEMIRETDRRHAPWTVVSAEDKRHARVAVLRAISERMKKALT